MVGQGVLRECLLDPDVQSVVSIGRTALGRSHPKLREIVQADITDLAARADELRGYDACFFCLGVSSAGMTEPDYRRVTHDLTLAIARTLVALNSGLTFIYVSGAGTDGTERGRSMWARVKGQTENALLRLPFKAAYMFRPGFIQPLHGITSRTKLYRIIYGMTRPLMPVLKVLLRGQILTTEQIGRAMINAVRRGAPHAVLEIRDLHALATDAASPAASAR